MATLAELARPPSSILRWGVPLQHDENIERNLYISARLATTLSAEIATWVTTAAIEETPEQQLDDFVHIFVAGKPLSYGRHFKPLIHLGDGVWELKTADVRLFGWFPKKDCFVTVSAGQAGQIKKLRLYRPYCEEAVRFRNSLALDEPKFVPGDDPNAVVSAFNIS